ncbi:TrbC/VirB2 family protein (plasmid) [Phyllobacterium sp. 628]|uniref:TrbC/VirB2 family protein n=1 Tax=Phyllobacterium sp. 628 TaxID=2718938 RepID=UPI0016627EB2|nr:TrbC/VirB2 family protein [Phyllobacterium sp. 628]QND54377.1 TrbC/VirB2 family protein [Phyllobacterium sp. 628]
MNLQPLFIKAISTPAPFKRAIAHGAIVSIALAVLTSNAFAQTGLQPVQSVLQTLITILTGPIASMIAILAVISCGFLAWTGRFTWGIAGSVIMGIVLVFGSTQIVAFFQSALGH